MALLPKGLHALKHVAKEVGLDLRGAYLNLDGGFDSAHNWKCMFNGEHGSGSHERAAYAEQSPAAACRARLLVPRSRFRQPVSRRVRLCTTHGP